MRRVFKGVSIVIHAVVIATISYVQVFVPGKLPTPNKLLAFQFTPGQIITSPPAPPARRRAATTPPNPDNGAPIEPPDRIIDEIPRQPASADRFVDGGIENGTPGTLIPGFENGGTMPTPPQPAIEPPPTRPVPPGGNVRRPERVFNVEPIYPALAQAARKEGVVILEVIIDTTGRVESVRVLRGVPMLDQAAVTAVEQWRFKPATLNGRLIPVVMTVTVNFQLTK